MLIVVGKIYVVTLVDRICKVIEGSIDDGFRAGRVCVDQIFTIKQIGEKA